jgi:hypothetical protein
LLPFQGSSQLDRVFICGLRRSDAILLEKRVTTYGDCWCRAGLLELDSSERDNILILWQFKQHTVHRRIALQDVGQAVVRCVVQNISNDVRVNASCYSPLTGQARVFLSSSLGRPRVRNMSSSVLKKGTIDPKLSTERSVCSLHLPIRYHILYLKAG